MSPDQARIVWLRKASAIGPLVLVILSSLIWSGWATYHHAQSPKVPGYIAWTLIAALDGSVVVTTPIWLSTVLPAKVRHYAGVICASALAGSMVINVSETGWPGLFPPLIAGALIHLVGVVLRAFARLASPEPVLDPEPQVKPFVAPEPRVVRPTPVSPISPKELVSRMLNDALATGKAEPTGEQLTEAVRKAGHDVNPNYGRSAKSTWKKAQREQVSI